MASILITDTPIIQALEAQDSPEFDELWSILQSDAVDGYITSNDLDQLDHHLHRSVGPDLAQHLVVGFRSVLSLYGEADYPAIDLILMLNIQMESMVSPLHAQCQIFYAFMS